MNPLRVTKEKLPMSMWLVRDMQRQQKWVKLGFWMIALENLAQGMSNWVSG